MERLSEAGQWIVLMGFVISIGIFFLAIVLNQSVLVGQTTAESVLEFPKSDIQDLRSEVFVIYSRYKSEPQPFFDDINRISLSRKTAVIEIDTKSEGWMIHFNNGITNYTEVVRKDGNYYYFHY
jgi:hypothetical protein